MISRWRKFDMSISGEVSIAVMNNSRSLTVTIELYGCVGNMLLDNIES